MERGWRFIAGWNRWYAVYILPPVDGLTEVDEDTCAYERDLPDIARSYDISTSLPDISEDLKNQYLPSRSKKAKV